MSVRLSRYGQASTVHAPVNRLMAEFAQGFRDGIDTNLGVGYVNEKTIPTALLVEAMQVVAADPVRYRQAFNYGNPAGSANLIRSLRGFLTRMRIGGLDEGVLAAKRIAIGASGATSILEALSDVMERGIVVTADPAYYVYADVLERKGFEIAAIPEDQEGPGLDALNRKLRALGPRTREIAFFYVVTVNNPSCTVLSNGRRRALLETASRLSREQNRLIPIVYDTAYELLLHDPEAPAFRSVLGEDELGLAYEIGTLSKVLAPALRMGYVAGPDGPLMSALIQKTSDASFSAPLFVQEMASYLLDRHIAGQLHSVQAGYRSKALEVRAAIDRELGPYLEECRGGSAGFYYYLTFRDIDTHPESAFFRHCTRSTGEPRVVYIPGVYCVHPRGELAERGRRQLRLSYGFEDAPRIVDAIGIMREAAQIAAAGRAVPVTG